MKLYIVQHWPRDKLQRWVLREVVLGPIAPGYVTLGMYANSIEAWLNIPDREVATCLTKTDTMELWRTN